MGKEETLKANLVQAVINYVRASHADAIDKAYEYFWDEKDPEEFLKGTALALGFINFEDWLIFDYKANEAKEIFLDIYAACNKELKDDELALLNKIRCSLISLYEVASVSRDKKITLKDLFLGGEFVLREKAMTRGLKKGDIFAARLLTLDGKSVMSGCVYPYKAGDKQLVLGYTERMFKRYKKNENPEGGMENFLKDYGDTFNMVWMNIILNQTETQEAIEAP